MHRGDMQSVRPTPYENNDELMVKGMGTLFVYLCDLMSPCM